METRSIFSQGSFGIAKIIKSWIKMGEFKEFLIYLQVVQNTLLVAIPQEPYIYCEILTIIGCFMMSILLCVRGFCFC
jgi:hypothetical protein